MIYIIEKEFAFEASHHLPQMPDGHKCKRYHGHSYRVIAELRSEHLDQFGFVRDFGEMDSIKRDIDEKFDHQNLDEVCEGGENTTAERLAQRFYQRWSQLFPDLYSVTVCETAKTRATFRMGGAGE